MKSFWLCTALSLLFLRSQFTPAATTTKNCFLMARHWPTYLAMRKGTVFRMMSHPVKFPFWSKRRDQEVQHYRLGTRAPFVVAAWPRFLHPSGRERKHHELHDLVWPCQPWGSWNAFWGTVVFPYCQLQQEKQHGSLWGAGLLRMCVNPCWEMGEGENQTCQQHYILYIIYYYTINYILYIIIYYIPFSC